MDKKDESEPKTKKKSIIASLDLKNYKAKYTDSFGNGKADDIDFDNFLIAEPKDNDKDKPTAPNKNISSDKPVTSQNPPPNDKSKLNNPVQDDSSKPPTVEVKSQDNVKTKEQIKPDKDFEKRVLAEADNDFYDKGAKSSSTFKSNITSNSDDEPGEVKDGKKISKLNIRTPVTVTVRTEISEDKNEEQETPEIKEPLRRVESYGLIISAIAMIYSITAADKGLFFLSFSLFTYLIRPIAAAPFGENGQAVKNALKGFSIALFFGAILFTFF